MPQLSQPSRQAVSDVQAYLKAAKLNASVAETTYVDIAREYERTHAAVPVLPQSEAMGEAISNLYGAADGAKIAAGIARDADRCRIFDAAEKFNQAQKALEAAGLPMSASELGRSESLVDINITRNAIAHPDAKKVRALPDSRFPDAAEAANRDIKNFLNGPDGVRAVEAMPESTWSERDAKEAARKAISQLQSAQQDLQHFRQPDGHYGPTSPSELTTHDVTKATEMREIQAGSNAELVINSLKDRGAKPNADLNVLYQRKRELAHQIQDAEYPGAVERAGKGDLISTRLPDKVSDLTDPKAVEPPDKAAPKAAKPAASGPAANGNTSPPPTTAEVAPTAREGVLADTAAAAEEGATGMARFGGLAFGALVSVGVGVETFIRTGSARAALQSGAETVPGATAVESAYNGEWSRAARQATQAVAGVAGSVALGAAAGSELGPVGSVAGAVAGGIAGDKGADFLLEAARGKYGVYDPETGMEISPPLATPASVASAAPSTPAPRPRS